ncbi:MAG: parallel beta-helix domain-containing protein, partial [Sphingomonadales bacterium]
AETHVIEPGDGAQEALQEALILAESGDVIELRAGVYTILDSLSLDIDGITIRGAGMYETELEFKDQVNGAEGLLITSNKVVVEDLAVLNAKGDGIKSKGSDEITLRRVRVEWTNGPDEKNGSYGLYPVESKNVLIDGSVVRGASDAGIYVGQSQHIIVRNSVAEYNVAGIEIENSFYADVYNNTAMHNTGGILVFDLPNLPQQGGHDVRVFSNKIVSNDTPNFAPEGNIVGMVARGTGVMIMANRNVHVFDNEIGDNATVNVMVVTYPNEFEDEQYNPHPRGIVVRNNVYGEGGFAPDGEVGKIISSRTGTPVPDVVWDGVTPLSDWLFGSEERDKVYINENDETSFANLRMVPHTLFPWSVDVDRDVNAYRGQLDEPEAVTLSQGQ